VRDGLFDAKKAAIIRYFEKNGSSNANFNIPAEIKAT